MDSVEATIAPPVGRAAVVLRFTPKATTGEDPFVPQVVTDTTETPTAAASPGLLLVRDVAERVLAERDLFAEAADLLDAWADAAGVVERMTVDGTSYWYYVRLGQWMWLVDRLLDGAIVDALLRDVRPTGVEIDAGVAPGIAAAARAAAMRGGIQYHGPDAAQPAGEAVAAANHEAPATGPADSPAGSAADPAHPADPADLAAPAPPTPPTPPARPFLRRVAGRIARAFGRKPVDEKGRRRAVVTARLERLGAEPGGLLVVLAHARQRIETADGSRLVNPYLGPIAEALRDSRLDPVGIELGTHLMDDTWDRVERDDRLLPGDAARIAFRAESSASGQPASEPEPASEAEAILHDVAAITTPLMAGGIDLGPDLVERIVQQTARILPGKVGAYRQIRSLLRAVRPSGILLADEYHRQEWLAAARAEGVASAAVQHGLIYRWHNGYIHRDRPAALRLADRTYVFGDWERRLLTADSVYRADEVVVGGSPRLDLVRQGAVDGAAIRTRLGVAAGDRLVILSATWGPLYRTYLYPIALARLFDRPLPRVHLVVKLHPSEPDEGPYSAVVEGVARAHGFAPPPITVVQDIDLYGLLAAADAHLGIHSTVLTEAVVTGTPNLLADHVRNADLLGYVEAGVATPVRNGADLLRALDTPRDPEATAAARRRFLDDHFEPGSASERIAADLLAWLP